MNESHVESVCIFGSAARNSTDQHSDRDVLVVAGDRQRRSELGAYWSRQGWSVASYTPHRFRRIVDARSLFVQHLKLEGRIVTDSSEWLSEILRRAKPKKSYANDAATSVALAKPIERFEFDFLISDRLISADLAYVALRNFGICYLADRNQLSFDYSQIVDRLTSEFDLTSIERDLLVALRIAKSCYRKDIGCADMGWSIGRLGSVLSKFFVSSPIGVIDPESPVRRLEGGYSNLRDFEASVVARIGRKPNEPEIRSMGLERIWRWITRPSDYTWRVRNCLDGKLECLFANDGVSGSNRFEMGAACGPIQRASNLADSWGDEGRQPAVAIGRSRE